MTTLRYMMGLPLAPRSWEKLTVEVIRRIRFTPQTVMRRWCSKRIALHNMVASPLIILQKMNKLRLHQLALKQHWWRHQQIQILKQQIHHLKVGSFLEALQWRHNECDSGSNHQPEDYYSTVYSGADQRKHQSSASLAFVRRIHRWPVNSPHKGQWRGECFHLITSSCNDVITSAMAYQITSLTIVCFTAYSGVDQRKHQSSASLAFVRRIYRLPQYSPHKGRVTRKFFHLMTSSWDHFSKPA